MKKLPQMSKFPVAVPAEMHRALKIKCAVEGVRMTEFIRKLIARELGEAGKVSQQADQAAA